MCVCVCVCVCEFAIHIQRIWRYHMANTLDKSQNHRITESQNVGGWKGPLWVI